jgi:hypothetical protein
MLRRGPNTVESIQHQGNVRGLTVDDAWLSLPNKEVRRIESYFPQMFDGKELTLDEKLITIKNECLKFDSNVEGAMRKYSLINCPTE